MIHLSKFSQNLTESHISTIKKSTHVYILIKNIIKIEFKKKITGENK